MVASLRVPMPGESLVIRADASPAIGAGHVMRCLALAKAWQSAGGSVTYLMAECIPALEERLDREGIARREIVAPSGSARDAEQTAAEALRANAAWLVVDGYRFDPDYVRGLKAAGLRVLFFDDDGRFDFYPSDVVLNQNSSASPGMYHNRAPITQLLLGTDYVLLRPEFLVEQEPRQHPAIAREILVTMGGTDPDNVTRNIVLALANVKKDIEAKIVVGGGNPWQDELQALTDRLAPRVKLERSPQNMATLMSWADVAVSAAGSTCWELAHMGLPSIVIALSADQQGIANALAERGIATSLGWHANLSGERISTAIDVLLENRNQRVAMSARGQKAVDGRGAARVVEYLQRSL